MKQILIFGLLILANLAHAQAGQNTVFSNKTFAKASTAIDTSGTIAVSYNGVVTIQTQSTGSDSSKLFIAIDGLTPLGNWAIAIARDTLTLGRPDGATLDSAHGQWRSKVLRNASTDLLSNVTTVRVRNTHASGSGDSTSALKYSQFFLYRK